MTPRMAALALLGGAVVVALATGRDPGWLPDPALEWLGWALAAVLSCAAAACWLTSFDRGRSASVLRIDWFTPQLRKTAAGQPASPTLVGRLFRRVLPRQWQSDRATKQRGLVRRVLRRLGLSWLASPVRRIVQTACLVLFLVLFFYVCWPYSARPAEPGFVSSGWSVAGIDGESGAIVMERAAPAEQVKVGGIVFLVDGGAASGREGGLGAFAVTGTEGTQATLAPEGELQPETIDALLTRPGPWALHEDDPDGWPSHYTDELARKEFVPAEIILIIDPLVSLSTAIASRSWVWSLICAGVILIVCVLIPRGFCGYICPLGTTIDLFDWLIGKRVKRFRVAGDGWWVHIKYYLLAGTLLCAVFGVLVSGFVSAIPVITRALLFLGEPLQTGTLRGWHLVPGMNAGHVVSILLFACVLALGLLRERFWCKYVCPSGAVFSLGNLFRATERKVESTCINCNKCVEICPFDAIKPDFTTRVTDCTLCQSCGGVCPTHAIKFVERWNGVDLKVENDPATGETPLGRRGFLSLAAGSAAAVGGAVGLTTATKALGANLDDPDAFRPVRPPGSVPEREFLQMCIRCGECFKACPNNVLQAEGFQQGLEGLWTPMVVADWAGCESSCNACGQVCPTGAIRALPLEEKRVARMGLAIVNETTCLPFAGREDCDLCVQECISAGYDAIEYLRVGTEVDESGLPIEGSGFLAPVVLQDKCVGCGLCQTRCNAINVKEKGLLRESAIIVEAGGDREDRILEGSYVELREKRERQRAAEQEARGASEFFVPELDDGANPFGAPEADDPQGGGFGNPFQ